MNIGKTVFAIIVLFLIVGGLFYWVKGLGTNKVNVPGAQEPEQVFCTMDAKLCPDGSYVGRQGPNCEFAACPGE